MAKKKIETDEEEEDGPEFIEEDLDELDDDMLADEKDVVPRQEDAVVQMLRDVDCAMCEGSSTKERCKIRDMHGCPPKKALL